MRWPMRWANWEIHRAIVENVCVAIDAKFPFLKLMARAAPLGSSFISAHASLCSCCFFRMHGAGAPVVFVP
jgi:hypothetical protein